MARKKKKERKMTGFGLLVLLTAVLCAFVLYGTAGLRRDRNEKLERQRELFLYFP